MVEMTVCLGDATFPYHYGVSCPDRIAGVILDLDPDHVVVIYDRCLPELHGDGFTMRLRQECPVTALPVTAGERFKTIGTLQHLLRAALDSGVSRRSIVVSYGGGTIGNIAGLVAGLLFRGVRLVHVPTTTMAAMDSVVSTKQAVNGPTGKNQIGLYHTPSAVATDFALFETLNQQDLRSGLCEAVKNLLAIHPAQVADMVRDVDRWTDRSPDGLANLLVESVRAKESVTRSDAKEQRMGLVLEYGHTVGHAIETCQRDLPDTHQLAHGEAVAIGMLAAAEISARLGFLMPEDVDVHTELIGRLGFTRQTRVEADPDAVVCAVIQDNKRGYLQVSPDAVAFVLLQTLGKPVWTGARPLVDVPLSLVREVVGGMNLVAPSSAVVTS